MPAPQQLPELLHKLLGDADRWTALTDEDRRTFLAIAAKLVTTGLAGVMDDLRVRWCSEAGSQRCGIAYGHVHFSGMQLWSLFNNELLHGGGRNAPLRRRYVPSRGLAQRNHNFHRGARERISRNSLHLSFSEGRRTGSVVVPTEAVWIEAHLDWYGPRPTGSYLKHLWYEGLMGRISFDTKWDALMSDSSAAADVIHQWIIKA